MAHELNIPNGFLTGNQSTLGAGNGVSPIQFTLTGSVLESSVDAGDLEVDSNGFFYYTQQNLSRQVIDCEQLITLTTAYTTAGGTTALQKLFNSPTNGTLTVAGNTSYFFECFFTLSSMSATSGTFSFGLGGTATYTRVLYNVTGLKTTAITAQAAITSIYTVATSSVVGGAANTSTLGFAYVKGKIVIGTGGTIIPSFATSVAAASVVGNDSYFRITPIGLNTVQSVGQWS